MAFTDKDYGKVLERNGNEQLLLTPKEKYEQYRAVDPFPEIDDTLLNSVGIVKYCMTTGMIEPFHIKEVKGVTYTCHFSGKYFYWDGTTDNLSRKTEADAADLLLRPNSITYLEIDEMLRVPDYLIIRYNLQVNHVYKGLLLGTGPIVDPGFAGHLYIPLHNLTSNEYRVKKGAPLITLEFTKVGRSPGTPSGGWPETRNSGLDFGDLQHQTEHIEPGRDFDCYLRKALVENELFRNTKDCLCVGSSIPAKIQSAEVSAKAAEASAKLSEESLASAQRILFGIGLAGIFAIIISIGGMLNDVNGRIDSVLSGNVSSVSEENERLQEENARLKEENDRLNGENSRLAGEVDDLRAILGGLSFDGGPGVS
ncbi:MAG: hypothetical protein K2P41_17195 [Lachnospiraceae bacterium]|nr:hypothetical protein [Lachnospiraceae bacterium]